MCALVLHAESSALALDQPKNIFESTYWTALVTHPKLSLIVSCVNILFDTWATLHKRPKFCAEVRDTVLKSTREDGGSRSSPED